MPTLTVDGKQISSRDRLMIMQACDEAGVEIPRYCYHGGLSIVASCRICLVEVEGMPKLVPSCQTPVRDGMVVHTKSTKAIANQKQTMEYLLVNHPLDCPVCDQAGECSLQDYSYAYGRAQSRFEEDKHKKPKKDVGLNVLLYNDRCIMCTRCVRFTREIAGTSELYVDGRGHREEIDIFPGKPLNNRLSGNVVDLCPVGALLDKDFLFKQRVWNLKETASISPVDSGGENIEIHHNENRVHRIKPRFNAEVNGYWISDDTRYSHKVLYAENRLTKPLKLQYGTQAETTNAAAIEAADAGIKAVVKENGEGSVAAVFSPMMACEEAFLLAKYIRSLDPAAVLVLGPVPTIEDEVFSHYITKKETFRIRGEKVPNKNGVRRVLDSFGGTVAGFDDVSPETQGKIKATWIVGGYLSNWIPKDAPAFFKKGFRVLQDTLATSLSTSVDVVIPAAFWAEKAGSWENYANKIQAFDAAVTPPEGVVREGDVYFKLLGRAARYNAEQVRTELGEAFAGVAVPKEKVEHAAFEFVEI